MFNHRTRRLQWKLQSLCPADQTTHSKQPMSMLNELRATRHLLRWLDWNQFGEMQQNEMPSRNKLAHVHRECIHLVIIITVSVANRIVEWDFRFAFGISTIQSECVYRCFCVASKCSQAHNFSATNSRHHISTVHRNTWCYTQFSIQSPCAAYALICALCRSKVITTLSAILKSILGACMRTRQWSVCLCHVCPCVRAVSCVRCVKLCRSDSDTTNNTTRITGAECELR